MSLFRRTPEKNKIEGIREEKTRKETEKPEKPKETIASIVMGRFRWREKYFLHEAGDFYEERIKRFRKKGGEISIEEGKADHMKIKSIEENYIKEMDKKFYDYIVEEISNELGEDKAKKFTIEDFVRIKDEQKDPARIKKGLIEEIEIVEKRIENFGEMSLGEAGKRFKKYIIPSKEFIERFEKYKKSTLFSRKDEDDIMYHTLGLLSEKDGWHGYTEKGKVVMGATMKDIFQNDSEEKIYRALASQTRYANYSKEDFGAEIVSEYFRRAFPYVVGRSEDKIFIGNHRRIEG